MIARIRDKGALLPPPTQNLQMMRFEPREEDRNVSIMLRRSIMTGDDKGKQPKESALVRKAPTKEPEFDLERAKEALMEAKKSFAKASTLGSKEKIDPKIDPSMLTTFMETCGMLLHRSKAVKGLQEIITRCAGSGEPRDVWKLGKHTTQTRREMGLTA